MQKEQNRLKEAVSGLKKRRAAKCIQRAWRAYKASKKKVGKGKGKGKGKSQASGQKVKKTGSQASKSTTKNRKR